MAFLSEFGDRGQYLLSVLNSKLFEFWVALTVHQYGDHGYRLSNQYVEQFCIPEMIQRQALSDEEVFETYHLSTGEVSIIENKLTAPQ